MVNPETRLFCSLDRVKSFSREKRRIKAIANLVLLDTQITRIFEQATQSAARFLEFPISFVGLMDIESILIKSLGLFSSEASIHRFRGLKEIPKTEAFCTYAIESETVLAIADVATSEFFSQSTLFQHYGIAAYLGVPLFASSGECLGTIAVADFRPRNLTDKQIEFLTLLSNWIMSEIKNCQLETKFEMNESEDAILADSIHLSRNTSTRNIKIELLNHLCQDLLTPLTSIKGMTSVLKREIYGPLNHKQKEYLDIINCSGKYMLSLVEEILSLDVLDESSKKLYLSSVDLEMVCQQAIGSVEYMAAHRQQKLKLSVPSESRIWLLDKDKVRQMLYYLLFTLLQAAETGSLFEIVIGQKNHKLTVAIGIVSPEYLQASTPSPGNRSVISLATNSVAVADRTDRPPELQPNLTPMLGNLLADPNFSEEVDSTSLLNFLAEVENIHPVANKGAHSRESLGLLLSYKLAELHGGQISVHQFPDYGCCYLITLPQLIKASI